MGTDQGEVKTNKKSEIKLRQYVIPRLEYNSLPENKRKEIILDRLEKAGFDLDRPIAMYESVTNFAWICEQEYEEN